MGKFVSGFVADVKYVSVAESRPASDKILEHLHQQFGELEMMAKQISATQE